MDLNDYQQAATRTDLGRDQPSKLRLQPLTMGLAGESGEFVDQIKKVLFHGHRFTRDVKKKAAAELGDLLWYLACTADALGYTLEDVAKMNLDKLGTRYPDGFTPEDSQARRDQE